MALRSFSTVSRSFSAGVIDSFATFAQQCLDMSTNSLSAVAFNMLPTFSQPLAQLLLNFRCGTRLQGQLPCRALVPYGPLGKFTSVATFF